ncbi:MAG: response regulator, partial [Deltaproteobacteria bacterium]|nr:response regulator [Deltaproteobacteria bacterium]
EQMSQKKILIIDDDPSFLEICSAILTESDYQVDTASNTEEGLKKILSQWPDLLLLDIMMATMDEGLNFATALKQRGDLRRLPIMIVSAQPDVEKGYKRTVDRDMDWISADVFMEKPINPQDLLHNVELLLN